MLYLQASIQMSVQTYIQDMNYTFQKAIEGDFIAVLEDIPDIDDTKKRKRYA